MRTRRVVLAEGLEGGGGGGGGGGGCGGRGGEGGGPSMFRLPKVSVGQLGRLPTDMTRRRPEEGEGERRRWGGCPNKEIQFYLGHPAI